jgi:hypothetical protein
VLRYDTRGAGLSQKVRGALVIDTMVDDLAALMVIPSARYAVLETARYAPVQTPELYARTVTGFLDTVGA